MNKKDLILCLFLLLSSLECKRPEDMTGEELRRQAKLSKERMDRDEGFKDNQDQLNNVIFYGKTTQISCRILLENPSMLDKILDRFIIPMNKDLNLSVFTFASKLASYLTFLGTNNPFTEEKLGGIAEDLDKNFDLHLDIHELVVYARTFIDGLNDYLTAEMLPSMGHKYVRTTYIAKLEKFGNHIIKQIEEKNNKFMKKLEGYFLDPLYTILNVDGQKGLTFEETYDFYKWGFRLFMRKPPTHDTMKILFDNSDLNKSGTINNWSELHAMLIALIHFCINLR